MTGETVKQEMPVMLDFGTLDLDVTEINVDVGRGQLLEPHYAAGKLRITCLPRASITR